MYVQCTLRSKGKFVIVIITYLIEKINAEASFYQVPYNLHKVDVSVIESP